jgi:protein TonB
MQGRRLIRIVIAAVVCVVPIVRGQEPTRDPQGWVGKGFILPGFDAKSTKIKLKKTDLSKRASGNCNSAVHIVRAAFSGGQLRFDLETIGNPRTPSGRGNSSCSFPEQRELTITGLSNTDFELGLERLLGNVLMTPEAFLVFSGTPFDLLAQAPTGPALPTRPGRPNPIPLLQVLPDYTDSARRARKAGLVELTFVVGVDGRTYSATIRKSLDPGLDEQSLRALAVWRWKPARQDGQPVATENTVQFTFKQY